MVNFDFVDVYRGFGWKKKYYVLIDYCFVLKVIIRDGGEGGGWGKNRKGERENINGWGKRERGDLFWLLRFGLEEERLCFYGLLFCFRVKGGGWGYKEKGNGGEREGMIVLVVLCSWFIFYYFDRIWLIIMFWKGESMGDVF